MPVASAAAFGGVVDELDDLLQVDLVRVANVEVGDGSIRHDVGRRAALQDHSWMRASGRMLARTLSMFLNRSITASSALRPFHGVI